MNLFLFYPKSLTRKYKAGTTLASYEVNYNVNYINSIFDQMILIVYHRYLFHCNNKRCILLEYLCEWLMIYQSFDLSETHFEFFLMTRSMRKISSLVFETNRNDDNQ